MDDVREQALAEAKRTYAGFITFLKWGIVYLYRTHNNHVYE